MDLTEVRKLQRRIETAENNNNVSEAKELYMQLAGHYSNAEKWEESIRAYNEALEICQKNNLKEDEAVIHRMIAETYCPLGYFENAVKHSELYLEFTIRLKNKTEEQRAYATIGRTYNCWAEYLYSAKPLKYKKKMIPLLQEGLKAYEKSLRICDNELTNINERERQEMKSRLHQNIGLVMGLLEKYEKAHIHFTRAAEINKAWNFEQHLYWVYLNQAEFYLRAGDCRNAIAYCDLAMSAMLSKDNKIELLKCKTKAYFKMGNNTEAKHLLRKTYKLELGKDKDTLNDLKKAVYLCKLDKRIAKHKETDYKVLKELYEKKADIYCALQQYSQSAKWYLQALKCAENCSSSNDELLSLYTSLTLTYKDFDEYLKALEYCKKEIELVDKKSLKGCKTYIILGELYECLEYEYKTIFSTYKTAYTIAKEIKDNKQCCIALEGIVRILKEFNCPQNEIDNYENKLNILKNKVDDSDAESEESFQCSVNENELFSDEENEVKYNRRSCYKIKRNIKGETELHVAAIKGDYKKVKALIEKGHPVNEMDLAGWTVLHEACNHGFVEIVNLLIQNGADVNHRGGKDCGGITPLHDAAENGHMGVIEALVRKGAGTAVMTDQGDTPLDCLKRWKSVNDLSDDDMVIYKMICDMLKTGLDSENRKAVKNGVRLIQDDARRTLIDRSPVKECPKGSAAELYRDTIQALKRRGEPKDKVQKRRQPLAPLILEEEAEVIMNDDWLEDDLEDVTEKKVLYDPLSKIRTDERICTEKRKKARTARIRSESPDGGVESQSSEDEFISKRKKTSPKELDVPMSSPKESNIPKSPSPMMVATPPSPIPQPASPVFQVTVPKTPKRAALKCFKIKILDDVIKIDVPEAKLDDLTVSWLTDDAAGRYGVVHYRKPIITLSVDGKGIFLRDTIRMLADEDIKVEIHGWRDMKLGDVYVAGCVKHGIEPLRIVQNALNTSVNDKKLDLRDKELQGRHLIPVLKSIENERLELDVLNLSRNFIEDEGVEIVMEYLEKRTVKRLYLKCNGITWRGVKYFSDRLNTIPKDHIDSIEYLDFSFNLLTSTALEYVDVIIHKLPNLKCIDVEQCRLIGPMNRCLGNIQQSLT